MPRNRSKGAILPISALLAVPVESPHELKLVFTTFGNATLLGKSTFHTVTEHSFIVKSRTNQVTDVIQWKYGTQQPYTELRNLERDNTTLVRGVTLKVCQMVDG